MWVGDPVGAGSRPGSRRVAEPDPGRVEVPAHPVEVAHASAHFRAGGIRRYASARTRSASGDVSDGPARFMARFLQGPL